MAGGPVISATVTKQNAYIFQGRDSSSAHAITVNVSDPLGGDTRASELNGMTIRVTATESGNTVQLRKQGESTYDDYVEYTISNYTGSKYGFSGNIEFNLSGSYTVAVSCVITDNVTTRSISGSDSIILY